MCRSGWVTFVQRERGSCMDRTKTGPSGSKECAIAEVTRSDNL